MGFFDNLKDALATGGDREAFMERRAQRLGNLAVKGALSWAIDSNGVLKHRSDKWTQGDYEYTVDATDDPEAAGGYFLSIWWPTGGRTLGGKRKGEHTTIVFDSNGHIANCKSNRQNGWVS